MENSTPNGLPTNFLAQQTLKKITNKKYAIVTKNADLFLPSAALKLELYLTKTRGL